MHCFSIFLFCNCENINKTKMTSITISTMCTKYGMKCFTRIQYEFLIDFGWGKNILLRQSPLLHPFLMAKLSKP